MGREDEQEMREMRGDGMPLMPEYKPSMYRFYIGAIAVGMAAGMSWLLLLQTRMTPRHAEQTMFGIVAVTLGWQFLHLWSEHKRMKILEAAIRKDWDNLKATYPNVVNLEQYKVVEKRWRKL